MTSDERRVKRTQRFQVVWWWPEWKGVSLRRYTESWALIYRWSLWLGFVEIRRWASA